MNGSTSSSSDKAIEGAKASLNGATSMNLTMMNGIIGGNSGSPLADGEGRVIGLIFNGNSYSIGGNFGYYPNRNRAVAVGSRALLAGLRKVYYADRIATEIDAAGKSFQRRARPDGRTRRDGRSLLKRR